MTTDFADPLPPEAELALAWTLQDMRPRLRSALELDRRLARIVARTREPMLGQMRLAWWRDAFAKPVAERPRGDAVLDALGVHWQGREPLLAAMVDGWEVLVTAERLGAAEAEQFAAGRGAFITALGGDPAAPPLAARLAAAGERWALADAAAWVSDPAERAVLVETGLARSKPAEALPRAFLGPAVLEALAWRALRRGGRPLMEGRGAPLAALMAAIFRA
jgi:phytoene synthase